MKNIFIVIIIVCLAGLVVYFAIKANNTHPDMNTPTALSECVNSVNQKYYQMIAANCTPAGDPNCTTSWTAMNFFENQREANLKVCEHIKQ